MRRLIFAAVLVAGVASDACADHHVSWGINADSKIFIQATQPQETIALNLQSAGGHLIPGDDPSPFTFTFINTPEFVIYGTPGGLLTLDGDLVTSTGYAADFETAKNDLQVCYESGFLCVDVPPVPEPNSGLLCLVGGMGLLGLRKRRGETPGRSRGLQRQRLAAH